MASIVTNGAMVSLQIHHGVRGWENNQFDWREGPDLGRGRNMGYLGEQNSSDQAEGLSHYHSRQTKRKVSGELREKEENTQGVEFLRVQS